MASGGSASAGWTTYFGAATSTSRQADGRSSSPKPPDAIACPCVRSHHHHRASNLMSLMQRVLWWQTGVIYQIYPRSFQDSNDDGIGDLRGITQRLSYLVELGVDAIWLAPIFRSPMADFGYDISDYTDIDPLFGGLDDFDALLA